MKKVIKIRATMKKVILPVVLMFLMFMQGCAEKAPLMADGESKMIVRAFWNNSTDSIPHYVPMANAKVILNSEYGYIVKNTDANGVLELNNLPCAVYNVSVRMQHPMDPSVLLVGTKLSIGTSTEKAAIDTIFAKPVSSTGIAINEIYAAGPVSNLYWYDQFIELYNSSDSVKYLDGMMVMRFSGNSTGKGPGADEGDDGDIDGLTYAFKFPGKCGEKNYPFPPKTFLVLASNAINHQKNYSTSVDLSHADWEFYNQYSALDMDNPKVPNLINMRPDITADFVIALTNDIVVLSNGKDQNWQDGIDISTILDAVEYQTTATVQKTLDPRLDRGYVLSPPRYSGRSIQRREAGVDTNDGSVDWETLAHPTPGYQK
ncbi:MAG: DUF4876 domain-containing protein [Ignavibacteria bacterium]|jgi:hypothetical protein|nr:DUF4876 domain-containing protein [Ignavibacteria bacterium]MCU7503859.1 DUF4876 domain-containing protein [Ignavibacteria bacterium]MCU7515920.1 DUF4876 domain-containing protein [Ignavibacteria bacterium]